MRYGLKKAGKIPMRRYLLFTIVLTVILLTSSAFAIEFNVLIDPSYEFYHPGFDGYFYLTNSHVVIELQMANNDGIEWCAYSMPLRIYGTGGVTSVTWIDAGGTMEPSIIRKNGFEEDGGIWGTINAIYTWGWDGILPDTMNHTVVGCMDEIRDGWPPEMTQLLTRLEYHFSVTLDGSDTGSVCIDSLEFVSDQRFDWLFSVPQEFGGPYCFPFAPSPCGDVNLDGSINILDIVYLINFKYKDGPAPSIPILADVNSDESINILDIVLLIEYKYKGGSPPDCLGD